MAFALLALLSGAADAAAREFQADKPKSWRLSTIAPRGSAARETLIAELTKPGRNGQPGLGREEVEAILDDRRANLLYGERLVKVMVPSMLTRQTQEHDDLLRALLRPGNFDRSVRFAREHARALASAEKRHGVPGETVVAILTFETRLGKITGRYRVFNALLTQALLVEQASAVAVTRPGERARLEPERQARRIERIRERSFHNLAVLLRYCKAQKLSPFSIRGSWAGAFGFPQFMPDSLRLGADGDGDGKINLFEVDDAIHSVARYLASAGYAKSPEQAVYHYNNDHGYVRGVLTFAKRLRQRLR
jgi:membrane-bound lytic murein transglycosylase B